MKLLSLFLLLVGARSNTVDKSLCPTACETDGSVDYFPNKVTFDDSTCLSITYHDYYKISTYDCGGVTQKVLYVQCGCTVPDDVKTSIGAQTTVSVPAKFHGIQSTTMTAFVHSLGLLDWVTLEINSGWGDTSNECFLDNLADGTTTQQVSSGGYDTSTHAVDFVFHNPGHDSVNFTSPIVFAEYQEKTFLAQSEWIKFTSLPFNQEENANNLYTDIKSTVSCVDANTATFVGYSNPPSFKVMFASYSTWGTAGWAIAPPCDVYKSRYCEVMEGLGVEMVGNGDSQYPANVDDATLQAFAEDVDVWISTSEIDATQLVADHPFIADFPSWTNKRVYDIAKRSQDDWYSSIGTQASTLQEDFAAITHGDSFRFLDGTGTQHETVFLRNIFNEDVGSFGTCPGDVMPSLADSCYEFTAFDLDLSGSADKVGIKLAIVVVAAAVVTGITSVLA